ncbi:MAG: C39 family peptidase [Candidatus Limnocylindrales bacterium]
MTRRRRLLKRGALLVLVAMLVAVPLTAGAVWTNALGAGDRFERLLHRIDLIIDPPPDRPTVATIQVTPRPVPSATPSPAATAMPSSPGATAIPTATASPMPVRERVDVRLAANPKSDFISQQRKDWCAPAGVQIALAILGLSDNEERSQRRIAERIKEWESRRDSKNGGWGPGAIAQALEAYGATGYELRAYERRGDALVDAARALSSTGKPVILIAWRGAHTWVMTGYRANADPTVFGDATVTGTYIFDPWYPRISSIWGASDKPGVYQDAAEMRRNFLVWRRPEGRYPDRDGLYLAVVPTTSTGGVPLAVTPPP